LDAAARARLAAAARTNKGGKKTDPRMAAAKKAVRVCVLFFLTARQPFLCNLYVCVVAFLLVADSFIRICSHMCFLLCWQAAERATARSGGGSRVGGKEFANMNKGAGCLY
jgi:hypothetical protein